MRKSSGSKGLKTSVWDKEESVKFKSKLPILIKMSKCQNVCVKKKKIDKARRRRTRFEYIACMSEQGLKVRGLFIKRNFGGLEF